MRTDSALILAFGAVLALGAHEAAAAPPDFAGGEPELISECIEITEPGSYRLAGNLPGSAGLLISGDCIDISASFVTIDLDGFLIQGDGSAGAAGITDGGDGSFDQRTGLVVRNGSITGFHTGIELFSSAGIEIRDMRVRENLDEGVRSGIGTVFENNDVSQNGSVGVRLGFSAIVTRNMLLGNGASGLVVNPSSVITGNVARVNTGNGLSVQCPSLISGNTAIDNFGDNVSFPPAAGCLAMDNVAP